MPDINQIIGKYTDNGNYETGFAGLGGLLKAPNCIYTYGISILRKLNPEIIDEIKSGPTEKYFNHYNEVNRELNNLTEKLAEELSSTGYRFFPVLATLDDSRLDESYFRTLTADISHKMIATRAGLGWIGKTDLFVSERFGPRLRLASILTDMPLPLSREPVTESRCGTCSVCVAECPGNAANGQLWDTDTHRNEFFDPFRCREYCRKISHEKLNRTISLCGKCISVCPIGIKH